MNKGTMPLCSLPRFKKNTNFHFKNPIKKCSSREGQSFRYQNADKAVAVGLQANCTNTTCCPTSQYRFANLNVTAKRRDLNTTSGQHLILVKGSESRKRFEVEGGKDSARAQACIELASGCSREKNNGIVGHIHHNFLLLRISCAPIEHFCHYRA
jgi:hypothetical protein